MKHTPIVGLVVFVATAVAVADEIHVPRDQPTIQAGIDAAKPGDTVFVADGVYTGEGNRAIDFRGKPITVRSESGPDGCIVDCEDSNRAFVFRTGETRESVLRGFTLTRGTPPVRELGIGGGAIVCTDGSSPTIEECVFTLNRSMDDGGGAMFCASSDPMIRRCTFERNVANGGGALHTIGSSPTIDACTFSENEAVGGTGGAISLAGQSAPTITDCEFDGNKGTSGGAIRSLESSPTVIGCTLRNNTADPGVGGAISTELFGHQGDPTFDRCLITGNTAGSGGGIDCNRGGGPVIRSCVISGNNAVSVCEPVGCGGGGISSSHGASPQVLDSAIIENRAANTGGGIKISGGSDAQFTNCLIADNEAASYGGGIAASEWGGNFARLTNTTIAGNTAKSGGGLYHLASRLHVANSLLWNNQPNAIDNVSGDLSVSFTNVQGSWPGEGNIDADPRFVEPDDGDFRLRPGSPCIDAANNQGVPESIDTDLDGNPRFVNDPETPDTGKCETRHCDPREIVDMGAYEFQPGCDVKVCQLKLKYKSKFQGIRVSARLCHRNGEPAGPDWRVCFVLELNGNPVEERCKATRRSGQAATKFADLTCGLTYEACVVSIQSPEGEDCTPPEPTCGQRIIGCLRP